MTSPPGRPGHLLRTSTVRRLVESCRYDDNAYVTDRIADTTGEPLDLLHKIQQLDEFIENLPDAVVDIDLQSMNVVRINHMTTIIAGFTQADVDAGLHAFRLAPLEEAIRMTQINMGFIQEGLERGNGRYIRNNEYNAFEVRLLRRDGTEYHAEINASYIVGVDGQPKVVRTVVRDISERKREEFERKATIAQLEAALAEVRTLRGLIPICAWCNRIRNDGGYWQKIEQFLREHSDADFTHSICDSCQADVESREFGKPA